MKCVSRRIPPSLAARGPHWGDIVFIALSSSTPKDAKVQTQINWASQEKLTPSENHMCLPLIDVAKAIEGEENTRWNKYAMHWRNFKPDLNSQSCWLKIELRDEFQQISIPLYIFAGVWDTCAKVSLKDINLMWDLGHAQEIRVWVDNTEHSMTVGDGTIRWLDWVIKGVDIGDEDNPHLNIRDNANHRLSQYRNRNWYLSWKHAHYYHQGVCKE